MLMLSHNRPFVSVTDSGTSHHSATEISTSSASDAQLTMQEHSTRDVVMFRKLPSDKVDLGINKKLESLVAIQSSPLPAN
jgi:hypothetical protein